MKITKLVFFSIILCLFFGFFPTKVFAQTVLTPTPVYEPCGGSGCPVVEITPAPGEEGYVCATSYDDWVAHKDKNFWVKDEEVTALGKAGERSRQFVLWVLTHPSVEDKSPVLISIWSVSRNVAFFIFIVVCAVMGLGIIVGKKYNLTPKIDIWPIIIKIFLLLLYIWFSASIVLFIIQLSEVMMKFFIERLGVEKLFNIFFLQDNLSTSIIQQSEQAYKTFEGCRNLNINLLESVKTSKFLINFTNLTYYFLGITLILRKIILWLLIVVSPFLGLLLPFTFIRNIGWIWIGVFFQWIFYGPLFALFLGALASIWKSASHIPYVFDFSRTHSYSGFIYPTTINILYGGPAQNLSFLNSSNYIDTFAEYIISLIMLWAVIFFPWWLLRIFRDYCCDGIYAVKNILLSMYDQLRMNPPTPSITPTPSPLSTTTTIKMPQMAEIPVKIKLETIKDIKKTKTEDISRALNLSVSKLTDVAHFETNRQVQQTVKRNLEYLNNPTKAETPTERQKYMNIRSELFNRAIKEDRVAKQILSSISTSKVEQIQKKQELIQTIPQTTSISNVLSIKVKLPQDKINSISNTFIGSLSTNNQLVNNLSQTSQVPINQVQTVLNSWKNNFQLSPTKIIDNISQQTGITKEKVSQVIKNVSNIIKSDNEVVDYLSQNNNFIDGLVKSFQLPAEKVRLILSLYKDSLIHPSVELIDTISKKTAIPKEKVASIINSTSNIINAKKEFIAAVAQKENTSQETIEKMIKMQAPLVAEPERNIEQTVVIPPTVSIEDYEEVKKMWINHYEKGEVPLSENIKSREEWIDNDIVYITNTLNKLLSTDEKLRQEGFDDLGYVLPIFLINNLKGEELVVYLKAKLEAAKLVKELLEKEKEITEKLRAKSEEELVKVEKSKASEKEETLEMKKTLD